VRVSAIAEAKPPRANCVLCKLPEETLGELDRLLADGTVKAAQEWLLGQHVLPENRRAPHRNTFSNHFLNHTPAGVLARTRNTREAVRAMTVTDPDFHPRLPSETDLAKIVVERVRERLADPKDPVQPTIPEGLRAQEILDKRGAQRENRDLLLQLAAVASGAVLVPVIEGQFREIDPSREEQETWLKSLGE
jgi:hypothetical protein